MARVLLVRHGEAAAAWGAAAADAPQDPGLSALGEAQAREAAARLVDLAPRRILTSPLRRCRETAAVFADVSVLPVMVEPAVAEIPSPTLDAADRVAWLQRAFAGDWAQIEGGDYLAWRAQVVAAVASASDAVVFTHFVAINAAVSAATGSERVAACRPANAAIVTLETDGRALTLVDLGAQAQSAVL